MKPNLTRPALFSLLALAGAGAFAQPATFIDNARVRRVQPQYETVQVPRNECTSQIVTEQQPVAQGPNYVGIGVGAVAGGVLGNQVGKGHGREAATAAGAVIGALAGNTIANNYGGGAQVQPVAREVQSCRTVYDTQNRLTGYRVDYEYQGQRFSTVTPQDPGQTLPVQVSVVPAAPAAPGAAVAPAGYDRPRYR